MPSLLDYGVEGAGGARFEAYEWHAPRRWSARRSEAVRAFLADAATEHSLAGKAATATGAESPRDVRLGMTLIDRPALHLLSEILDDGRPGRSAYVACPADPACGATTFLRIAAREARRRGYVPLAVGAIERRPELADALRGRQIVLLRDGTAASDVAVRWLLRLCALSPGGHMLLCAGPRPPAGADATLALRPLDIARLEENVHWHPPRALTPRQVRRAATESGGIPGLFLSRLRHARERAAPLLVAEARAPYVPGPPPVVALPPLEGQWSELLERAERLARAGRRAAADRELRRIAAAAERRQLGAASARAEVRLGSTLLARGRIEDARAAFASAADRGRDDLRLSIQAAIGTAAVHVEAGALDSAESILRAAHVSEPGEAVLPLARCLCWQGRYAEAERLVRALGESTDALARAGAACVAARTALAQHDLPRASQAAASALAIAQAAEDLTLQARAHELLAAVHGRIADVASASDHGGRALRAARRAGLVLGALRIRATAVESVHAATGAVDRRLIERMAMTADRLPALTRGRLWAMAARVHPCEPDRRRFAALLQGLVKATGAHGLLPIEHEPPGAAIAKDVSALLAMQTEAADARVLLQRLAEWLRERGDARIVHVVGPDGAIAARAGTGERIAAAERALVTRAPQPPWTGAEGLEAAVPLRLGAAGCGALACRWPLTRQPDPDVMPAMLAAAAVAAPALASLVDVALVAAASPPRDGIVGRSPAVLRLRQAVARAGAAPFPVLIEGESGVGKELVARAIHASSPRRGRPYVAVNCAALSDDLFESELFGHARGAFTGAHADRAGLFEQADGGTLFLDEISELSSRGQAKLLRALQEGEVRRVGENFTRRVDARIVVASNRSLDEDASAGRFRKDLLFRLAVVRIPVPPLRARPEDIPLLAAHYWQLASERAGSRATLTPAAIAALSNYAWPGNVRELQNVLAALTVHVPRGRVGAEHVEGLVSTAAPMPVGTLDAARQAFDRQFVASVLARCGGRHAAAARQLGVSRQGLAKLMRRLSIDKTATGHRGIENRESG